MWRCGNVGNVGQINISLTQWPHFAGRAYCIHTAHSSEWSEQYSARHLAAHTRSDVFSERVSSLLWREYSDQGPGAVINIRPPLTRGHGTLSRETASNWSESEVRVMVLLLKIWSSHGTIPVCFISRLSQFPERAGRANGSAGHFSGLLLL